jgi:carboxymethylenebutenolidase
MLRAMRTEHTELGFLARPGDAPAPGVVMLHDVWGLADHTRDLAARLAGEGFAVLAVDLYRGLSSRDVGGDPGRWIRGLSDPEMLATIQTAIDALAGGASRGRRVGITGFCMGGQYAILAAAGCTGLSAAVPFYGMLSHEHGLLAPAPGEPPLDPVRKPRSPLEAAAHVRCPVLALFGADDAFIPVEDVRALERELAKTGPEHVVSLYAGAGHAFLNDTRPELHRPAIAAEAWSRLLHWLHAFGDGPAFRA